MTKTEFNTWLEFHCKAFGDGLRDWIAKGGADAIDLWYSSLWWQTLDEAKAATQVMFSDEDQQPHGWSRHPARLNKITNNSRRDACSDSRPQRKFIDGVEVFDCGACEDTGIRTIVNTRSGKPARTSVACVCHHGNKWSQHKDRRWRFPVFNDKWMIEELATTACE